jgi:hypothetical protein
MFLKTNKTSGYNRNGEQYARGPFLIVFSQDKYKTPGADPRALRAAVRTVSMHQCGHFMMGRTKLGQHQVTLSGSYGRDGLTCDPSEREGLWDTLLPVPKDLEDQFWAGGGHNTSGSEGPAMREWALANEKQLRKAGKKG